MYRHSSALRYELLLDRNQSRRGVVNLIQPSNCDPERRAAVGFVRYVDGIRLQVSEEILSQTPDFSADLVAALRPLYFRHMAMRSEILRSATSSFGTGLLVTSALGMLIATSLRQDVPLSEAWSLLTDKPAAARKVLGSVLAGEVDDDATVPGAPGRRTQEVTALWTDPVVAAEMDRLTAGLWEQQGEDWQRWLRTVFLETLRAAVEVAVQSVLPEVPENDFSVEVLDEPEGASVWVLEAEAGGIGVIDRLLAEVDADPTLFDTALEASLTACHAERIVTNVEHSVHQALRRSSDLDAAFAEIRDARSYADLEAARVALVSALVASGCDADRDAVAALVGKALMPGSSAVTDRWIRRLTRGRQTAIDRLGIAIDTRVWAYWTTTSRKRRSLMVRTLAALEGGMPEDAQITSAAVRLTLDPCRDSCPDCLGSGRDMHSVVPSRRLVKQWLNLGQVDHVIDVGFDDRWLVALDAALTSRSRVRIRCDDAMKPRVGSALAERLAAKHDRGYVLSGFRVAGVTRTSRGWETLIRIDDTETL